jgi:hypothetical protein
VPEQSLAPRFDSEEMSPWLEKVQLNRHRRQKHPNPAEKARGGEIILNTPVRRAVLVARLPSAVSMALLFTFLASM